jgi:multicomponent Na+:H+ antiporter subunit B
MTKKGLVFVTLLLCYAVLLMAVMSMPPMGDPKAITVTGPPGRGPVPRYVQKGLEESGAKNIITNIILNYRGYDTSGEVTVIFTALMAVLAILNRERKKVSYSDMETSPVERSVVVYTIVRILLPFILLFSLYVILFGEAGPGGGFQGGTIIAAAAIIFTLVFGYSYSLEKLPTSWRMCLEGIGPLTFIAMGLIGLFLGRNYLTFMFPQFSHSSNLLLARSMLMVLEIGIGAGGALIFTSIFFAMQREDKV